MVKIQSGQISTKPAPDQRASRLDSNGVNDTQVRANMEEIESIKVEKWERFKCHTI